MRVIFFYILYSTVSTAVSYYLFKIAKINASYINDIYTVAEYLFFSAFLYHITTLPKFKRVLILLSAIFILFFLCDYFFLRKPQAFNSTISGVEAVMVIILCVIYFFEQIRHPTAALIYSSINFWIIISFLLYLSGTFFLFILTENMIQDRTFLRQYSIINSIFVIIKYVILAIAMTMKSNSTNPTNIPLDTFPEDLDVLERYKNSK